MDKYPGIKKITGSVSFEVEHAAALTVVTQSDLLSENGVQHQVQHPIRPDVIVGDAAVTICVHNKQTGKENLIRTGRVAKPSGDTFRDYMAAFSRADLMKQMEKPSPTPAITFKIKFSVRLLKIGMGCPDVSMPDDLFAIMDAVCGEKFEDMDRDVTIIADKQPDHPLYFAKKMLIQKSEYFRNYFSGVTGSETIFIHTDTCFHTMLTVQRYIHCAEILITPHSLLELIPIAHKFKLHDISFAIGSLVTKENVFQVWETANEIDESGIADMAEQFVNKHLLHFFKKETFRNLPLFGVSWLLEQEKISIPESQIWNRCYEWLLAHVGPDLLNRHRDKRCAKRSLVEPFIRKIRFPLLKPEQLREPINEMIFSYEEIRDLFNHKFGGFQCRLFNPNPRTGQMWEEKRKAAVSGKAGKGKSKKKIKLEPVTPVASPVATPTGRTRNSARKEPSL